MYSQLLPCLKTVELATIWLVPVRSAFTTVFEVAPVTVSVMIAEIWSWVIGVNGVLGQLLVPEAGTAQIDGAKRTVEVELVGPDPNTALISSTSDCGVLRVTVKEAKVRIEVKPEGNCKG